MKKHLLLLFFFSLALFANAQTEKPINPTSNAFKKYLIKLDSNLTYNVPSTSAFIKMICAANTANYSSKTQYFEVLTKRDLDKNVISGKLQKNATPMSEFIYVGQVECISNSNTLSTE